jgi:site-specific recombinase XerD
LQRRQLRVIGTGDNERVVPFGARTAQALLRYINLYRANPLRPEYDNVFLSLDGMLLTRSSLD